jgi:iron-sulfur cluster repair protein YtfE (RIC family)
MEALVTNPAPLPHLFGRFTVILKDHDHLEQTLSRLREMCAELESPTRDLPVELSPPPLLQSLYADLSEHFAAEESPAYFGTVLEEAPSLAQPIAALEWEHASFLADIERLQNLAEVREQWPQLALQTRELVAELERHEQAESVLLRQLFFPAR